MSSLKAAAQTFC